MFGELKQRSVLWDEPRAAAERVGVNYFMALFCRNYFFFATNHHTVERGNHLVVYPAQIF